MQQGPSLQGLLQGAGSPVKYFRALDNTFRQGKNFFPDNLRLPAIENKPVFQLYLIN